MPAPRSRRLLLIGAAVVVVLAIAGAVAWFVFLKGDADPALKITDSKTGSGKAVSTSTLDGTWKVVAGTGDDATVAGYRVKEEFAAGARKVTANGRTNGVTGDLTVAGGKVTAAKLTVDMTTLASDEGRRDQTIKQRGLETNQFPTGTFELTRPIALPVITDGKVFTVKGAGKLTLHGVTKAVSIDLNAKVTGDTVTVQGAAPIVMADYAIEPPSIGGFVSVSDSGSLEFLVSLQR